MPNQASPRRLLIGSVLALQIGLPITSAKGASFFTGLGFLQGDSQVSLAHGISGNGQVVVGESRIFGRWEGFRWTAATGIQGLGPGPGTQSTVAFGASFDGSRICGVRNGAATWTEASGWQNLAAPNASSALAMSHDGTYIAGQSQFHAVRFGPLGQPQPLGSLGMNLNSQALGISDDGGTVVGVGNIDGGGERPFKWTGLTGMVALPTFGGGNNNNGGATAISADASTTVGWSSRALEQEAVMWNQNGLNILGTFAGDSRSMALDVSGNGELVVGWSGTSLVHRAFIWDHTHGMQNLKTVLQRQYGFDLTGWTLEEGTGISDDGLTITGLGTNPNNLREAWVVHVPGPGGLAMLLALIAPWRRRVK